MSSEQHTYTQLIQERSKILYIFGIQHQTKKKIKGKSEHNQPFLRISPARKRFPEWCGLREFRRSQLSEISLLFSLAAVGWMVEWTVINALRAGSYADIIIGIELCRKLYRNLGRTWMVDPRFKVERLKIWQQLLFEIVYQPVLQRHRSAK